MGAERTIHNFRRKVLGMIFMIPSGYLLKYSKSQYEVKAFV
jgi:hypothetical protein